MDERITAHDGRMTAGRKGIPYDWQGVLAHRDLESPVGESVGALVSASVGAATYPLGNP